LLLRADSGDSNLMPVIFDAMKAHATVGEISASLRAVFGEYHESAVL
jgi:methylmalonyl-CoA mutase N-terminal domain/subunit